MNDADSKATPTSDRFVLSRPYLPWTLLAATFGCWIASYAYGKVKSEEAEAQRTHEMRAACGKVIMWLEIGQKLKGLNAHAFDQWIPLAKREQLADGNLRYVWDVGPTKETIGGGGWIVIQDGNVIDGGYGWNDD